MSRQILAAIQGDLASAPATRIIYVEGKSDVGVVAALLGITPATVTTEYFVHKGTLVKELGGRAKVEVYVNVAATGGFAGKVFGILDGDGDAFNALQAAFDAPFAGPLFRWKAYAIESLFPQCPWDSTWGTQPNWQVDLEVYAPYVALFRTHQALEAIQQELHLEKGYSPTTPLRTIAGEKARLAAEKHKLTGFDAEAAFDAQVALFQAALAASVEEAMAYLDGKWLFSHFMVNRQGSGGLKFWRERWKDHLTNIGGVPVVRDLWTRITGSAP